MWRPLAVTVGCRLLNYFLDISIIVYDRKNEKSYVGGKV
jgi:hypothetical protein